MSLISDWILDSDRTIAVAGHVRPDGDCVGSTSAAYRYLVKLYPDRDIFLFLEPFEESLLFLTEGLPVRTDSGEGLEPDLCIALDVSSEDRIGAGKDAYFHAGRRIVIDHHETNPGLGEIHVIEPETSSASEVLYGLLDRTLIDRDIATALYTGIVHDTGVFQYDCTGPETLRAAAELISRGVPFPRIIEESVELRSYRIQKLTADVILNSRLYPEEKLLVSCCPASLRAQYGAEVKELGSVVTSMNRVREAEVTLFMYESAPGVLKGSLRSRSDVNVAEIAAVFGGGGHRKAAGFSTEEPFDATVERIRAILREKKKVQASFADTERHYH